MAIANSTLRSREPDGVKTIIDWRLNAEAFYFKFCETTRSTAPDDSLIRGITISLEHLTEFLTLPVPAGAHGGRRVGYANCARYLELVPSPAVFREST